MPFVDYTVPARINKYLRDYQRDGIRWLMRWAAGVVWLCLCCWRWW
jgi:hypothetical protein